MTSTSATTTHFADRLHEACRDKGAPICVGLDPVFDRLPDELRQNAGDDPAKQVAAVELFCAAVLDAVADHAPCVKIQAACFERYHTIGFGAMFNTIAAAKQRGMLVILDAKRGDIGTSAAHYAAGLLAGPDSADALTVNSYLGADSLQPFMDVAAREGKGLFALVRTSNPGGDALQGLALKDGRTVAEAVADMVADVGGEQAYVSESGYSLLGAVVGATKPDDAATLRRSMWRQVFLVPGFGAQGGTAEDVKACFHDDGSGAIITASRSVIYAYEKNNAGPWREAVAAAAGELHQQIAGLFK